MAHRLSPGWTWYSTSCTACWSPVSDPVGSATRTCAKNEARGWTRDEYSWALPASDGATVATSARHGTAASAIAGCRATRASSRPPSETSTMRRMNGTGQRPQHAANYGDPRRVMRCGIHQVDGNLEEYGCPRPGPEHPPDQTDHPHE